MFGLNKPLSLIKIRALSEEWPAHFSYWDASLSFMARHLQNFIKLPPAAEKRVKIFSMWRGRSRRSSSRTSGRHLGYTGTLAQVNSLATAPVRTLKCCTSIQFSARDQLYNPRKIDWGSPWRLTLFCQVANVFTNRFIFYPRKDLALTGCVLVGKLSFSGLSPLILVYACK